MRRIPAVLILLTVAAFWAGCGEKSAAPDSKSAAPASKSANTGTTYPEAAPSAQPVAPSGGAKGNSNTSAPRIKPPT